MSALVLMSLLGLTLLIPVLSDDDTDPSSEPDTPEPPLPPEPENPNIINGTDGADVLSIDGEQRAFGLDGDDTLTSTGAGNDSSDLEGGRGDDLLIQNGTFSFAYGGEGNDTFEINGSHNSGYGGADDDSFTLSGSQNSGYGEDGNDVFTIDGENNSAYGESGDDVFIVSGENNSAYGESGDDVFTVDGSNNFVSSGAGNDTVTLSGERGSVDGRNGDDMILAEGQDHSLQGDGGNDTISVDAIRTAISGGAGNDEVLIAADSADINARTGAGDDTVSTAGTRIDIDTGDGNDTIHYGAVTGEVRAGEGDDSIVATPSDRGLSGILLGEGGDDTLRASDTALSFGTISMNGGAGADTFALDLGNSTSSVQGLFVTIADFNRGEDAIAIDLDSQNGRFTFEGLNFVPAPDGSYTDVIATLANTEQGGANAVSTIRVQGVDDVDLDDVAVAVDNAPVTIDPLVIAAATLDQTTNTVTVVTDPDETDTIYTVANRVDAVTGSGSPNYVYETSVLLAPEGLDLSAAIEDALDPSESVYYYDILNRLGVTELAVFPLDPSAAPGAPGALPDFVYPEDAELGFAQIYSTNFGDGGQIGGIIDVEGEANLLDDINEPIFSTTISSIENNGGTNVTLPTDFEGKLIVLETTTDYFSGEQLVLTEVSIDLSTVEPEVDFVAQALMFADDVTETTTDNGTQYTINDGSLTERELTIGSSAVQPLGGTGVSIVQYDNVGNIVSEETTGGIGVNANVEIERYLVETVGTAIPTNDPDAPWSGLSSGQLVTSFSQTENTAAEGGEVEGVSIS